MKVTSLKVTKRNGQTEDFTIEKFHKILEWAVEGINGVSVSDIEMNAKLSLYDGIPTKTIHDILVKSAVSLISLETPNYQWVASRLLLFALRKHVWGSSHPPSLSEHLEKNKEVYDEVLYSYSDEEIAELEKVINHERDYRFTYAGLQQLIDKYLLKDRRTDQIHENAILGG